MFNKRTRRGKTVSWLFWAYDAAVVGDGGKQYIGTIEVVVYADTYAEARRRAEELSPLRGPEGGYELRSIAEHEG